MAVFLPFSFFLFSLPSYDTSSSRFLFFQSYPKKEEEKKKRIRRIETLENLLDLTLFPITCPDFLLASTFSPFFYLSFLPTILPRRRVPREKDDRWEENFFQNFTQKFCHKSFEYIYMYISRPGKGSRVISRSRVSSDRNGAEVSSLESRSWVEMHAHIHICICIKWPRSIYYKPRYTFRVCYTTSNVHYIL